jgi:ABC-type amino acid transport substrate-binding protein
MVKFSHVQEEVMSMFKKIFPLLFLLLLVGCNQSTTSSNENNVIKSNETKSVQKKEYKNIDKIVVPKETEFVNGLKAYQEFSIAVIKHISEKYNIPVKIQEITNFEDALIALEEGRVDVVLGAVSINNPNLKTTYSYLSSPLYFPNGIEIMEHKSYRMAVNKKNKDLLKLLNNEIIKMKENGELDKLRNEYLGEREKKEHLTVDDITYGNTIEQMTPQERDTLLKEIDEYSKVSQ